MDSCARHYFHLPPVSGKKEIVYVIKCKYNVKKVTRAAKMLQTLPIYLFSDEDCPPPSNQLKGLALRLPAASHLPATGTLTSCQEVSGFNLRPGGHCQNEWLVKVEQTEISLITLRVLESTGVKRKLQSGAGLLCSLFCTSFRVMQCCLLRSNTGDPQRNCETLIGGVHAAEHESVL
ncbi:hypothetical protein E5288_WYG016440 [Bos mutus]|uniref:Uncharacterized protein n=1 Tax=Bos mutus TaxID=72004 RepID=A0A6B0REG4_9CETA|nr:hypothetical protein [Bos mutus]